MEEKILSAYYDPKSSGSLGSIQRVKRITPQYSLSDIKKVLQTQPTYTKFKPARHKFIRRKYNIHTQNYLWQSDLIVLSKYAKINLNYKYIVTCIDCFSKKGFAVPIKNKTGIEVVAAFKQILSQAKSKPKFLQVDLGKEYYNKTFQNFLKANNIQLFSVHSDKKAAIVERFNRTLMMRISKWFHYSGKFKYLDVLDNIIKSYNDSKHRTISRSPNQVTKYNEMDVWLQTHKDLIQRKSELHHFNVGDFVRIKKVKGAFDKGYAASYSNKLYTISQVLNTNPVTFKLKEGHDELLGIFYPQELSKVLVKNS